MKFVVLGLLAALFSLPAMAHPPTEKEMRDFLKVGSEEEFSCTDVPLHIFDFTVDRYLMARFVPGAESYMPLSRSQLRFLVKEIGKHEVLRVMRRGIPHFLFFSVVPGSSELDILRAFYELKVAVEKRYPDEIFIRANLPCPGGVSVGDL